jgi:hypothetical protein
MSTSCSDFTSDVWGRLIALNLVDRNTIESDDLAIQSAAAVETITMLSDKVSILTNLLSHLAAKLPENDAQAGLPLDGAALGFVDQPLRDQIAKAIGAGNLEPAQNGPASRFMSEVLDVYGDLADIADQYNQRTLADVAYLHSAIHKKTYIEVDQPTDSRIVELVRELPSADFWQQHIYLVSVSKAA